MFVKCPQCRAKLRIEEEKVKAEGSSLKCSQCGVVLRVNKPLYSLAYFINLIFAYIFIAGILAALFEKSIINRILGIIMILSAIGVFYWLNIKVYKKYVVSKAYQIMLVIIAVLITFIGSILLS